LLFASVLAMAVGGRTAYSQSFTFTIGSMNAARDAHTATLLDNGLVLIAAGGYDLASAELYDPSTGTFTLTGSLNTERIVHTATLLNNGMVLVAGGQCDIIHYCSEFLASAELYDPGTGTFAFTGSMSTARWSHTATLLNNGMVLVAGGFCDYSGLACGSAELYNPATGIFTPTGNLNFARYGHTATLLNNGMVLIAGGQNDGSSSFTSAELYNPATGTFSPTGSMNMGRENHTATLLNNGMVLVAGGSFYPPGYTALASAELYDPASGTFTPTGSLNTARSAHTATPLNNGMVLMAGGGNNSSGVLASAELYNPASGTFAYTGSLNTARSSDTATLLNNGTVLIAGGSDGNGNLLASAELYIPAPGSLSSTPIGAIGTNNPQMTYAEPVATGNGNYFYQHTDLSIPGRGMPLVFERSYNTLDSYSGPFGANWTHSYNIVLTSSGSNVTIKWGDAHSETYTLTGGVYVPPTGVFNTLVQNTDSSFWLTQKNQTRYLFSATGTLTNVVDKNGNTISLTYNGGNLTQITDTVGRNLTLTYDGSNRITQIADPIGRTVIFAYSANNDLAQVTDPAAGLTQFTYDTSHHVTSITLPNGDTLLQNTYDSAGRVVTQSNGRGFVTTFAYDTPSSSQTTITDPRGKNTIHTYDASLRITTITDALGGGVSYSYDANNDRTGVTNQNGATTSFGYDGNGNLTSVTDALGDSSTFTYDAKNNLLTSTNPKGKTTTFSYDANGNMLTTTDALGHTTSFAYDGAGELTSKTDANGHTSAHSYDSFGNLNQTTDALGDITSFGYDGIGRLVTLTDPNHHTATSAYDSLSRLTATTDPLGHQAQFTYDAVGNLVKVVDANGNSTSYTYDAVSNLVTVTDALGHVTQYAYDPDNNRTTFTNAKAKATSYAYDDLNRLSTVTDPLGFATLYTYDSVGNVTAVKDAKGKTNQFAYDALNRLITISYADGNSVAYSYDLDGNRTTMVDSHGTTAYAHDDLDRLTSVSFPGGGTVAYGHDAVGNRSALTYADGKVVNYAYDAGNRLISVTDWLGRLTGYSYDAASNLLSIAYPSSPEILPFSPAGIPPVITLSSKREVSLDQADGVLAKGIHPRSPKLPPHDLARTPPRIAHPNQQSIIYTYDAANRLTSVENLTQGAVPGLITYTLDAAGNRIQENVNGTATAFGYDPLSELISVRAASGPTMQPYNTIGAPVAGPSPAAITSFAYDAVGNRLSEASPAGTVTYSYDAADRMLSAGSATFSYDNNGNQTTKTSGRLTWAYSYDAANRLIKALGYGMNSTFGYDGDGNRISQTNGAGAYNYTNDVGTALPVVLNEQGPDGNITYAYGLGLIEEYSPSFNYFYHYDGLGSVIGMTDGSGKLQAAYTYDPWGNALSTGADAVGTKNKFRFTGQALDPGTGLYFLRARYYDTAIGRFSGKDPLSGMLNHPVTLNRYLFALNRPTSLIDPSGLTPFDSSDSVVVPTLNPYVGAIIDVGFGQATEIVIGGPTATIVGLAASVESSVTDALMHPQRDITDNLARGFIDLTANAVFSLGSALAPPSTPFFIAGKIAYQANKGQIQNALEHNPVIEGGNIHHIRIPGLGDFTKDVILDFGTNTNRLFGNSF
jgi:RHS repeat-associated protein